MDCPILETLEKCICEEYQKKENLGEKKRGHSSGQGGEERCCQDTNAEIQEKQQVRKYYYCKKRGQDILRQEGEALTNSLNFVHDPE